MFKTIALFEFSNRVKQPQFWIFALALFLITLLPLMTAVQIFETVGNVDRSSDYIVIRQGLMMGILGALFVGLMTGPTVTTDHDSGFSGLLYAMPLKRVSFILGRFVGSFAAATILLSFILLSICFAALLMEGHLPSLSGLATVYFVFLIPSAFIVSAISFSVTTLTGRSQIAIVTTIALFFLYTTARSMLDPTVNVDDANNFGTLLADPFGWSVLMNLTEFWTLLEKNTKALEFGSELWLNRVFWVGLASTFLLAAISFRSLTLPTKKSAKQTEDKTSDSEAISVQPLSKPVTLSTSPLWPLINHEIKIIKTAPFIILLLLGLANYFNTVLVGLESFYSFQPLLTSTVIADATRYNLPLSLFLLMTYCTGELMWGDRKSGYALLKDSMPSSKFQILASKFLTSLIIILGVSVLIIMLGIFSQTLIGDAAVNLTPYLAIIPLSVTLPAVIWLLMGLFIQSMVSNRYIGYFLMVAVMISNMFLGDFGVDNHMFKFGNVPSATFTDFNGFGHLIKPYIWFNIYWLAFGGALFSLALIVWNRGVQQGILTRLRGITMPSNSVYVKSLAGSLVLFGFVGGFIYYNTAVVNDFQPKSVQQARSADYEKAYAFVRDIPKPKIIDADLDVAFYPSKQSVVIKGTYKLENRTDTAISKLYVNLKDIDVDKLELQNASLLTEDKDMGVYVFEFDKPLLPSEKTALEFTTKYVERGFKSQNSNRWVIENGSIINNMFNNQGVYFPHIGFNDKGTLTPPHIRAQYGLAPVTLDEATNESSHLYSDVADWITYRAVVSTNSEQTVVAPGNLVKSWSENGRNYSKFESSVPMINAYVFASAKYDVKTVNRNGVDIVIYSHPDHAFNLGDIVDSASATLDFYSNAVSPYPYNRLNIIEVPNYRFQGQSYPSILTMTSSFGFLQKTDNSKDLNWLSAVVAHELGHQWWMNQLAPALLPGATVMTESLSNYGHLQIGKKLYGEKYLQNTLKTDLARYLQGRGNALETEVPLSKNIDQIIGDHAYINYSKGTLATHAISKIMGESNFNAAMKDLMGKYKHSPDYPKFEAFETMVLDHAPEDTHEAIDLWLNRVVFFKHEAQNVSTSSLQNGAYDLTLKVNSVRLEYDTEGLEQPLPGSYKLDLRVYDTKGNTILDKEVVVSGGQDTLSLTLPVKPGSVELDPDWKWLEINRKDNIVTLSNE